MQFLTLAPFPGPPRSRGDPRRGHQHIHPVKRRSQVAPGADHDHLGGGVRLHSAPLPILQPPVGHHLPGDDEQVLHQLLERRRARLHGGALPHHHQEHRGGRRQRVGWHRLDAGAVPLGFGK